MEGAEGEQRQDTPCMEQEHSFSSGGPSPLQNPLPIHLLAAPSLAKTRVFGSGCSLPPTMSVPPILPLYWIPCVCFLHDNARTSGWLDVSRPNCNGMVRWAEMGPLPGWCSAKHSHVDCMLLSSRPEPVASLRINHWLPSTFSLCFASTEPQQGAWWVYNKGLSRTLMLACSLTPSLTRSPVHITRRVS